jgi:hypothetical protein
MMRVDRGTIAPRKRKCAVARANSRIVRRPNHADRKHKGRVLMTISISS